MAAGVEDSLAEAWWSAGWESVAEADCTPGSWGRMRGRHFAAGPRKTVCRDHSEGGFMNSRCASKSPELLGPEEIRSYQVYLTMDKILPPSSRQNWS